VQRVSENEPKGASEPSDKWSEIDVGEGEMVAASDVIEFIAEVALGTGEERLKKETGDAAGPGEPRFEGVGLGGDAGLPDHWWFLRETR
jgi:hypothetical protein